jgi:hypothetical protein
VAPWLTELRIYIACAGPVRRPPLPADGCHPLQYATGAGETDSSI